jgi:demethylmenaquinone methyltransferase/2-methoxy-6-polyprenyl-1,4-benzoquinol methylase
MKDRRNTPPETSPPQNWKTPFSGPPGQMSGKKVRAMFNRLARRYRCMNRVMTFGQDTVWRRMVVREAAPPRGGLVLDVASGTGDIALEALRQVDSLHVVGADFAEEMMHVGRCREKRRRIMWCALDALSLPFPDETFDAVTSGYLMRNVGDPSAAFREQTRVVRRGGRVVCLDTSPPPDNVLRPVILFYLRRLIPLLGRLIASDREAYAYLAESTEGFKEPEELAEIMRAAGLTEVRYRLFMFGTVAVHTGRKTTL